jgi:mRNA-degrading endonuclease toxin of MazEF toxin-antitoxin module
MDPMRGEVWDARLPQPAGFHPVVVLTTNALITRLSAITVAVITGGGGPPTTHVQLDHDVGLTGHDISYVNATDIHSVAKPRLTRQRGRLDLGELERVEDAVRAYLDL